jgi:replicative DNA helicase
MARTVEEKLQRVPPQNIEAEQAILGGVLLDNTAIDRVLELLAPEDFYREAHRKLFRAMVAMTNRGEPVDVLTLTEELRREELLQEIGGAAYLAELLEQVPTAANVAYYARIVREKAILRSLIETCTAIAARAYDAAPGEVDNFLDHAEQELFRISERRFSTHFTDTRTLMLHAVAVVEDLFERKEMITGVPTGFIDLDRLTGGLQPSDLIIVAARPGLGKTAFALNVALNAARHPERGVGVAIFSLEMSKEQLGLRMLCSEARVDPTKLRTGSYSQRDLQSLVHVASSLAEAPIMVDDSGALSILELRAKARRLKRDKDFRLGLVIVDYLQLLRCHERRESREQEISLISRSLKALAKELNVPIMALAQLNRQVETRANRKPILADLRESGAIEQDADVIIFLSRPHLHDPDADPFEVVVDVAKQRNGPTDEVRLHYTPAYTRFEDYVPPELDRGFGAEV